MKCILCENFSFSHICNKCQKNFLQPSISKRKLSNGIEVISFYKYKEIKDLLHTKHTDIGFYIYNILAQNYLKKFASEFKYDKKLVSIPIDDNVQNGYSHTAILNKHLKSKYIKPIFNTIRLKNKISYSGKTKIFRQKNPRVFQINDFKEDHVILVDDIVTTGYTLSNAISQLKRHRKNVLVCLALADAGV